MITLKTVVDSDFLITKVMNAPKEDFQKYGSSKSMKSGRFKLYNDSILSDLNSMITHPELSFCYINERHNGGIFITSEESQFIKFSLEFSKLNPMFELKSNPVLYFGLGSSSFTKVPFSILMKTSSDLISENFRSKYLNFKIEIDKL